MNFLKDEQYYMDRYDLITINICLERIKLLKKVFAKMNQSDKLSKFTEEEIQRNKNYFTNMQLIEIKLDRYKKRAEKIEKDIEEDRKLQDAQDNTLPPQNIKCDKCKIDMQASSGDVMNHFSKPIRVLFFFDCPKCKKRKAHYENGEIWKYTPTPCAKCGGKLKTKYSFKSDISTITTTCSKCDYRNEDVHNHKVEEEKRQKHEKEDKDLLEKYRDSFCMKKKEAEDYIKAFDEMDFANQVYKYELQKYDDVAYEKSDKLKKLSVTDLEDLLNAKLPKLKFNRLTFKEPKIDVFVEIEFTTQDMDSSRRKRESERLLQKLLKDTLELTNWRLMIPGISYRLGYLSGKLKGYEREDDILKLLGKKEENPKIELDKEKLLKYQTSGSIGLARLSAEYEGQRKIRLKRFKDEPNGFLLNDKEDSWYTCNFCGSSTPSNKTWWMPEAITCTDCHNNILKGLIPKEILGNDKLWFTSYHLNSEYGLHSATVRKYIRTGELISRDLKNSEGNQYFAFFLAKENKDFFTTHFKKAKRKQKWHFVDEKGKIVWL
ncbi:hypothetical protein M0R04_01335 [Candidatus Dojkabacteria bacterium]|jgi:hypothetical protein|nr:hypothetical protein [Candidatus Dojkabacteria bacterium]